MPAHPDGLPHPLPIDPDLDPAPAQRPGLHPGSVLAVAAGGIVGGLTRYEIGLAWPTRIDHFPAATFVINTSGAFVLACVLLLVLEVLPPTTYVRPLLGTGFCGAYTTFSAVAVSGDQLVHDGRAALAAEYVGASLAAGLAVVVTTLAIGRHVARTVRGGG